jgi:radical SAM superfamily enzyme YgiQ (UPF0313 family)
MIHYEGQVYRPPSEGDSLILQATIGCSYNECTFCGMYRGKGFRIRPIAELRDEIAWARAHVGTEHVRKVFLADGDALVARASFLHEILDELKRTFPRLRRVSVYASPQAIQVRTVDEMRSLREAGLRLYYLGIETGHDDVLRRLRKGVTADEMIECGRRVHEAGVRLSVMILLGAGGQDLSLEHARESARVVNAIQPRFLSTLVMTPVPGTPLWDEELRGAYRCPPPVDLVRELREFLGHLDLSGTVFRSNHASNHLAVGGSLPKDRQRLLDTLDAALEDPDTAPFRPEWLRGL